MAISLYYLPGNGPSPSALVSVLSTFPRALGVMARRAVGQPVLLTAMLVPRRHINLPSGWSGNRTAVDRLLALVGPQTTCGGARLLMVTLVLSIAHGVVPVLLRPSPPSPGGTGRALA